MRLLSIKLSKVHKCDSLLCNKKLDLLQACKGCKCAFYCSKKCQQYDWKTRHRKSCVSIFMKPLTRTESSAIQQVDCIQRRCVIINNYNKLAVLHVNTRKVTRMILYHKYN